MAILRSIPKRLRGPSYRGLIMIDAVRGTLRVRKWPKKRGRPRSALQRFWVDWFTQANKLAKYADGMSQARAIAMTKDSGLYPRDVLLMAMRGRLYNWQTLDGWRWYSVAAQGDISESLDVLAQTVGDVLVRAPDRWRAPAPGVINDVLTNKGPLAPAAWQTPGGGISQSIVAGTPITPDGTQTEYILDVSSFAQIELMLDLIGFDVADRSAVRLSSDGGASYHAGASDYMQMVIDKNTGATALTSRILVSPSNATANHVASSTFANLRVGREAHRSTVGTLGVSGLVINGFARFDSPITHLKLYAAGGNKFSAGTIRAIGF